MKLITQSIALCVAMAYQTVTWAQVCPADPRCLNNPYGAGNPYKGDGLNNPYSEYGNPNSNKSHTNPYATDAPRLYDQSGNYRGRLSSNPYDPDSVSNPYGRYGNPYSGDSLKNPVNRMQVPVYVVPQRSQSQDFGYAAPPPNINGKQALGAVVVLAGAVLVGMALKAIFNSASSAAKNTTDSLKHSPAVESTAPATADLSPVEKRLLGKKHLVSAQHNDHIVAALYFREAADEGDVISHFLLATMYMEGKGVSKDLLTAFDHFKKAADGGHEPSQVMVGDWAFSGKGTTRNYELAFMYYKMAADGGSTNGAVNVGVCYLSGNGVAADFREARRWLEMARDGGNRIADYYMGLIDFQGLVGGNANYEKGFASIKKASDELDLPPAAFTVGYAYQNGLGVERDLKSAADYHRRAASKNYAPSAYALASMYEYGEGVVEDKLEAARLYKLAGNSGIPGATMKARLLERTIRQN